MIEQEKIEVLQRCKDSLTFLGKAISPQTYYLPSPSFHKELDDFFTCDDVQGVAEAPRATAKSSKAIAGIMRHIIFDEGDKFVIIQSKTRPEAINRLTKIKNILEYSHNFRDLFGYSGESASVIWREDKITTKIGGDTITIKALGTGQQVRGALEDDTRITYYLLDDPDDEDSTKTKERMDDNFDKFLGGIAGLDKRNGRVRVIGTPVRQGCIVERIRNAKGWFSLHFKAYNPETKTALWEEMHSYKWLMEKKAEFEGLGKLSKFYSEYLCEIVGDEDQLFKPKYFRHWDGGLFIKNDETFLKIKSLNKVDFKNPIVKPVNVFLGVDPASSVKKTADYSVIMAVAYDAEMNIYVLPYFRKRVNPLDLANAIYDAIKTFKPKRGHIESTGYQEMLRQTIRAKLKSEGVVLPGLEKKFNPRTEKSIRLETLQPLFAQHKIFLKDDMEEFEDELMMYPRGRHDDMIDGLFYATVKLIQPYHTYTDNPEYSDDELMFINGHRKRKQIGNWKIV